MILILGEKKKKKEREKLTSLKQNQKFHIEKPNEVTIVISLEI